jgi:hypothetical protein
MLVDDDDGTAAAGVSKLLSLVTLFANCLVDTRARHRIGHEMHRLADDILDDYSSDGERLH